MPRKGLKPRERRPDPAADLRYNSVMLSRLVSKVMRSGKRSTAQSVVYGAMDIIKEKSKSDPLKIFDGAVENVRPLLEVKPRRVGGATYQVPVEVRPSRGNALSLRWILQAAWAKTGRSTAALLAEELLSASKREGAAYKKREDTHKMAEANRTFAHYRW